jgi:HTH-type transcriptional repressor of NAD biosynthesis genes
MARQANRLLFCDTDPLLTTIWSEVLFGCCPDSVRALAGQRRYDLYLLMDVDCPWINDGQRFLRDQRKDFFQRCRAALDAASRRYVVVGGNWDQRLAASVIAIEQLIRE